WLAGLHFPLASRRCSPLAKSPPRWRVAGRAEGREPEGVASWTVAARHLPHTPGRSVALRVTGILWFRQWTRNVSVVCIFAWCHALAARAAWGSGPAMA